MKLLDDNVLIKIEIIEPKSNKIILPDAVREGDSVERKFFVESVGPDCEEELVSKKVWINTFCEKMIVDKEHFLIKRASILAYED